MTDGKMEQKGWLTGKAKAKKRAGLGQRVGLGDFLSSSLSFCVFLGEWTDECLHILPPFASRVSVVLLITTPLLHRSVI